MAKKGQVDNGEEFIKLFPNRRELHEKDMNLRKQIYGFQKSPAFNSLQSHIKIGIHRAIMSVKSSKSNILRGFSDISIYESNVYKLECSLVGAVMNLKNKSDFDFLKKVDDLEKNLLELPSDLLKTLLLKVIEKSGVFLCHEDQKIENLGLVGFIELHKKLKKKYLENFQSYTLAERRHIGDALNHLGRVKNISEDNKKRAIQNYCNKILRLRDFMGM